MPTILSNKLDGNVRSRRKGDQLTIEQDWHFLIKADSFDQDRASILHGTSGVPQWNTLYGSYGMMMSSADGDRMTEDPLLWNCVYHLSNVVEEGNDRDPSNGNQQTGDPTVWIPQVELGFEDYDEVLRASLDFSPSEKHENVGGPDPIGYNARKWVNSAGQPYDTGFVRRRRIISRQFTQFEKMSGPGAKTIDQILDWNDTINDREYLGRPKRTLKLTIDKLGIGTYYSTRCFRIDMSLHFKKDDWRLKQLDVGWHYKVGTDLVPFKDKTGAPILGALDGLGGKAVNQDDPGIRYHKEHEDLNFSTILRVTL
jgi:hypothetical protein